MRDDITVREVMNREFVGVSESDTLRDAVELMVAEDADSVVVLRGRDPVGSLSARDALASMLDGDPERRRVGDAMRPTVRTVPPNARLVDAQNRLVSRDTTHLLVIEGGDPVGVVAERDVLAAGGLEEEPQDELAFAGTEVEPSADIDGPVGEDSPLQSICELCGSLTADLTATNGQAVCPDCREY